MSRGNYYLARSLVQLRNEVNSIWPGRSKVSDGWIGDAAHSSRTSDHNPDWGLTGPRRGVVRALDVTTSGINPELLLKHTTNDSRVAYVIYNRRIYQHSSGWQPYRGTNPHTNHIHISIRKTSVAETNTKLWFGSADLSNIKVAEKPVKVTQSSAITNSIVVYLNQTNRDSSFTARSALARTHGIRNYKGTAAQNTLLLSKIRALDAVKPGAAKKTGNANDPNTYKVRPEAQIRELLLKRTTGKSSNSTPHLIGLYQRQQIHPFPLFHDQIWGPATDAHFRWVGQLQKAMNEWKGTKLEVDGNYMKLTHARVLEIQENNRNGTYKGYKLDGIAGPVFCKMIGVKTYPN